MRIIVNNLMKRVYSFLLLITALLPVGCQTSKVSEYQRFETSVRKELPFQVDSLRLTDEADVATFQFANREYVSTLPDAEIGQKGELFVYRNYRSESPSRQTEAKIWRNVVVSKKNHRVICIDRYLRGGRTQGYIYVFQSETEKFPTYSNYHWDVSDPHNIEMMGGLLNDIRKIALKRAEGKSRYEAPTSQETYWTLMFHADSLFADHLYTEAKQVYDLAFTDDRFILPSQLSTVANNMAAIGNSKAALEYLNHRVRMEKDFYEDPLMCPYPQLKDTFEVRQKTWNYDLSLKEKLEWLFERDQYSHNLWYQAANRPSESPQRIEMLAQRAMETDSINLIIANQVLSGNGFPRKSKVGEFATMAVWIVFQHNTLECQKQFLPQLEEAVRNGDIAPAYLAALKDRIDIREGRPQKYGTQKNGPLLDATRVNEWRQEIGLPPLEP